MRFWRSRPRAGATPIFDSIFANALWPVGRRVLIAAGLPIAALAWFGQPAVRMVYWYHGPLSSPVYERCEYLALDGWHIVTPRTYVAGDGCPMVLMIPADISALLRG